MRKLVLSLCAVFALCAQGAPAQELKLATLAPDGSNWMNEMRAAADTIGERTGGEVRLRFYPGGVMGDAGAVLRRMHLGQLHGGVFTLGDLNDVTPVVDLYTLPFIFESREEVQALRPEFDPLILEALEQNGIIAPAISLGGFAYLFSRHELPHRAGDEIDSDLRIWVPAGDELSSRTLEMAGANPVPLPLAEVYTSLQTGAVNTFAATPSAAIIMQWHTRARYMLDMPLLMTAGTVGFSVKALDRLERDHREILLEEIAGVIARMEQSSHEQNREARAALRDQGIEFLEPDAERTARWQELAEKARAEARRNGELDLPQLDTVLERLGEMRAGQ